MKTIAAKSVVLVLAALLTVAACAVPSPSPTARPAGSGTAIAATVLPASITPAATPATNSTPPAIGTVVATASAAGGGTLSPTDLKYQLLAQFGDIFFCDPDLYPVARGDEQQLAIDRFQVIQSDSEKFQGIIKHLGYSGAPVLDESQKLAVYREFKKLNAIVLNPAGDGYQFSLRIPNKDQTARTGYAIEGTISRQAAIAVTKNEPALLQCPICLPAGTSIATPGGPVPVEEVRPGLIVWTQDRQGERVALPVIRTGHVPVPAWHQLVRLQLSDGRAVSASPGHPTKDGRLVGDLRAGDWLDGAAIVSADRVPYQGAATYDLLPAGDSGVYWADGVLLLSTLR